MKITIVTNALYKNPPKCLEWTDELKRRYCDKHGMTYMRLSDNPLPKFHPHFSKFHCIEKAFNETNCDWVVWMDHDAAPVNMDDDLRDWLATKPKKVIMLKDALGWNAGVFCVPNCVRTASWLSWLQREENIVRFSSGYHDQDEMAYTFTTDFRDFVLEDGYEFGLNNYDDIYPHKDKPNLFVDGESWCLHIPGYGDDYRTERFGNVIRKLEGMPELHRVRKEALDGKTVMDYVESGSKSILIDYPHGLGDVIMFMPHFKAFAKKCQKKGVNVDIRLNEPFRYLHETPDESRFDTVIWFPARFNERETALKGMTKPQANVVYDLGDEYNPDLDYTDPIIKPLSERTPFVGLNFCCSCYPKEGNCCERTARILWEAVQGAGFIPIEVFVPKTNRSENIRFSFVKTSMRDIGLGIPRMMSVMSCLRGVASVSTGSWHYGMAAYPERTLYLRNQFDEKCYTNKKCLAIDVNNPDRAVIGQWLENLKAN